MFSEGNAAHPVACDSPLRIVNESLAHFGASVYPQGAYSEQDSIQSIFLFINPLPPHASSGTPPVSPYEEAAGDV
jgi:hypothetical protein